jgi:hypothetical protein
LLWTQAGLVPRIIAHLQRHERVAEVEDQTIYVALLDANTRLLQDPQLPEEDQKLLRAVATSPRGQVVVRGAGNAAWAIATIGSLLPKARILIVASNNSAVVSLNQHVARIADRPVTVRCEDAWRMEHRMLICTPNRLSCASVDDWDCVVFADVQAALSHQSFKRMMQLTDQLRYVICFAGQRLGQRETLRLEAICGAEIYHQPEPGGLLADVTAHLVRIPGCPPLPRRPDYEKKLALWHNSTRNVAIAQLRCHWNGCCAKLSSRPG